MLKTTASHLAKRPVLTTWIILVCLLLLNSILWGYFGDIGGDSDDQMRWLQVRDLIEGQSWFDPMQYRMGLEAGTVMHWSRLVDLPIFLLMKFFDLFLPLALAESVAITFWPPLTTGLVLAGLALGARAIGGEKSVLFVLILSAAYLFQHFRFLPGALDHHNLQIGVLALALGGVLWPAGRSITGHPKPYALAGLGCALSLAIGVEGNIFVGIFCAYVAIIWALEGKAAQKQAQAFGLSLAGVSLIILITTIHPANYLQFYCDAFSGLIVIASFAGGIGLFLVARLLSETSLINRFTGLVVLGAVCAGVLLTIAPQCLSNPINSLSPDMKTFWLDQITEARPLLKPGGDRIQEILFFMGMPLLALILSVRNLIKGVHIPQNVLFIVLILIAAMMTVYQVRFYVFLHLFALLPASFWVATVFVSGKAKNPGSVAYIFAAIIASPMAYLMVVQTVLPSNQSDIVNRSSQDIQDGTEGQNSVTTIGLLAEKCYAPDVLAVYDAEVGVRILAGPNGGPPILLNTDDTIVFGNYHRNIEGISSALNILLGSVEEAEPLLKQDKIDYLHFCDYDGAITNFQNYAPNGFVDQIRKGTIPDFLAPVPLAVKESGAQIYKVIR